MDALLERHPIEFDRQQCGKLVILRSEAEIGKAKTALSAKQSAGLKQRLLTPAEAIAIEPALSQSPESIAGALYAPDDETGDCHTFCKALLEVLRCEYGAEFLASSSAKAIAQGRNQSHIILENGERLEGDLVLVANGWRAPDLLSPLGHRLPIEAMKGYSFTAPKGNAAPTASITDHARRIVFTDIGDRILVAGIAEMGRIDAKVDPTRLASVVEAARASLPEAANYAAADEGWTGFRPMTPNSQPVIRMLGKGLAVNAGQGMLGWTLAMGSAEHLSAILREND